MSTVASPSSVPPARGWSFAGIRRVGLGVFFVSLGVNALLGITAILSPDFGQTAQRTLSSSLMVTAFLLACLAVEPAWERRRLWPVPALTVVVAAVTFVLGLVVVWGVVTSSAGEKLLSSLAIVSTAGVVACLLALARLRPPFGPLLGVDLALLGLATTMLVRSVVTDGAGSAFERALGVVMVLLAAAIVATPVVHWLSRSTLAAAEAHDADETRFCPFCGARTTATVGAPTACGRCGSGYTVGAASRA